LVGIFNKNETVYLLTIPIVPWANGKVITVKVKGKVFPSTGLGGP
jgi:hypothetical protein